MAPDVRNTDTAVKKTDISVKKTDKAMKDIRNKRQQAGIFQLHIHDRGEGLIKRRRLIPTAFYPRRSHERTRGPERQELDSHNPGRLPAQFQPRRVDDPQDGIEVGAVFTGKRLLQAFAWQARIARDLRHALGAGHIAQRLGNVCGIAPSFFKAGFAVGGHFFCRFQMFSDVMAGSRCLGGLFICSRRSRASRTKS